MNLRKKTLSGLTWNGAAQAGQQISQFIITAMLARLLLVSDFGLMGMALVFTRFAIVFNETGVTGALIQKIDIKDKHLYSVFWLNIVIGILLMSLFMFASPFIAEFYGKPELCKLLKIISLSFVIASFGIVQKSIFTKNMSFKKLAIINLTAVITAGVIAIYLAYNGYGVLSLVYQLLITDIVRTALLWILSKWRPSFKFSLSAIKEIIGFTLHLTGFEVVNYFARNIDYLLIGKFLGAMPLGLYTLAYQIMVYPLRSISSVVGVVMFPAFSQIQNDLEKVRKAFLKMVKAVSLVTFPMMFGLFAVAPEFINIIYGPKWEPVILLIRIFCVCGMIQSIGTLVGNIMLSQGRADLQFKLQILGTFIVTLSIVTGLFWGINGVAFCYTVQAILWVHFTFYITNKLIGLKYRIFYSSLKNSYFLSSIMLVFVFAVKLFLSFSMLYNLIIMILTGFATYIILLYFSKEVSFSEGKLRLEVLD